MKEKDFQKLIKKNKFQVFLFSSPVPIPLCFAVHTWFVVNLKGKIHRWDFGRFDNKVGLIKHSKYITFGMNIFRHKRNPRFKSKLVGFIEGGENSIAKKWLCLLIEDQKNTP